MTQKMILHRRYIVEYRDVRELRELLVRIRSSTNTDEIHARKERCLRIDIGIADENDVIRRYVEIFHRVIDSLRIGFLPIYGIGTDDEVQTFDSPMVLEDLGYPTFVLRCNDTYTDALFLQSHKER